QFNIKVHYANNLTPTSLEEIFNPNIKAIFAETISNPSLEIIDIKSLADYAHSKNIPLLIDNTVATPFLVNPIDFGCDIVVHSSSKYINGSADSISGVIIDSGKFNWDFKKYPALAEYKKFNNFAYIARLRKDSLSNFGGCLAPLNAYLNIIGLETLGLRMERICNNAKRLAEALTTFGKITVNYPLLSGNKYTELAKKELKGFGGGILTLRAGTRENAFKIINSLKITTIASNIGDVRTLVIYPATTLYLYNTKEEMNAAGVFDDTIRISVGIEDIEDLIADFKLAIESIE
nr:PLP-dependent transferase [Treponema sp.]